MISFEDIRPRLRKHFQEGFETSDYIMRVSKTPKEGIYAYEELGEIVRCKDCKWRVDRVHNDVTTYKCSYAHGGPPIYFPIELDNFCCWGERKVVD